MQEVNYIHFNRMNIESKTFVSLAKHKTFTSRAQAGAQAAPSLLAAGLSLPSIAQEENLAAVAQLQHADGTRR
jgi:hypothetical protein